jgi:hypothetical protein
MYQASGQSKDRVRSTAETIQMIVKRQTYAGHAPADDAQDKRRHDRVQGAIARARVTIPLGNIAQAEKEAQRQLERAERAQLRERPDDETLDGDPRLTLYVVDRIIWLAHWMDRVSLNQLPPKGKRTRAEITDLCREEHPEDLIELAWVRLARRNAPVLERVAQ